MATRATLSICSMNENKTKQKPMAVATGHLQAPLVSAPAQPDPQNTAPSQLLQLAFPTPAPVPGLSRPQALPVHARATELPLVLTRAHTHPGPPLLPLADKPRGATDQPAFTSSRPPHSAPPSPAPAATLLQCGFFTDRKMPKPSHTTECVLLDSAPVGAAAGLLVLFIPNK